MPSELRVLSRLNEALFTDALFDAVRDTMLTLVRDVRHVGGTPCRCLRATPGRAPWRCTRTFMPGQ